MQNNYSKNEKTLDSTLIYSGAILDLEVLTVELQDGTTSKREIVRHKGACAILAIHDNKFVMVKQYRKAIESDLLEIPAGKLEKGEDPLLCAIRELQEETGYIAENFELLLELYPAVGFSTEVISIYTAENLTFTETSPDEDEFVSTIELDFKEAYEMIMRGDIKDSKTICAVLKYFIKNNITY